MKERRWKREKEKERGEKEKQKRFLDINRQKRKKIVRSFYKVCKKEDERIILKDKP